MEGRLWKGKRSSSDFNREHRERPTVKPSELLRRSAARRLRKANTRNALSLSTAIYSWFGRLSLLDAVDGMDQDKSETAWFERIVAGLTNENQKSTFTLCDGRDGTSQEGVRVQSISRHPQSKMFGSPPRCLKAPGDSKVRG